MVVFGQKILYSGKSGCIGDKAGCIRANMVVVRQSGCIRAKVVLLWEKWLYLDKVVVFGQK